MDIEKKNRVIYLFLFFVFLYSIIIINLYFIQIINYEFFKNLGDNQYKITIKSMPLRANFYDRYGNNISINKDQYSAFVIPNKLEDINNLENFLLKNFPEALIRLKSSLSKSFCYLKRKLSDNELEIIKNSNLNDIKLLKEPGRFYTNIYLSNIIGITDINNNGILSLEYLYNKKLSGEPFEYILEKDARIKNSYFKRDLKKEGIKGEDIHLTIDSNLQYIISYELEKYIKKIDAKEAAVLVLDPSNSELLALSLYPYFDSNNLNNFDINSSLNIFSSQAYELGSVIKVFLALAAIDEGIVEPDDIIDCENSKEFIIDGFKFSTWKAHGNISFKDVIKGSNNIGVAKVSKLLGSKLFYHYKKLGFGSKIGIFPGENIGFINPPHRWSNASLITLSFGYEISINLLQLARAFSVVANDGYISNLNIVKDSKIEKNKIYRKNVIEKIKYILEESAQNYNINLPKGFKLYAKTGTARLLTNGLYDKNRHIYTFMAILENQKLNYKRLIITFIKEPNKSKNSYASLVAVPLFKIIAEKIIIYDKLYTI